MEDLTFCFVELQKQGFLRDINSRRVFLNYGELLRCNLAFWNRSILPMLEKTRFYYFFIDNLKYMLFYFIIF